MKNFASLAGLALVLSSSAARAVDESSPADDSSSEPATLSESQATMKTEKHADVSDDDSKPKADAPSDEDSKSPDDSTYGHGLQFGLRAGVMFGYRTWFRYDKSPLCAAYDPSKAPGDQRKLCGFGSRPGTEVAISFAVFDSIEPYIFGRFGFSGEAQTNTKALMMYGVGARIYTMSDSRFKIFVEPALAYEVEGGAGNPQWQHAGFTPNYGKDLIFHVGVGPQYDFAKAFGIFASGAVDVGVLRAISATLSLNIGAQVRFL